MKNFLKFIPKKEKKAFNINKANPSPTLSKDMNIKSSVKENNDILANLLHYPTSNDVQFRFFDITINNTKHHAFVTFYDGLTDTDLINDYIIRQLIKEYHFEEENTSLIKKKNELDLKKIITGSILAESQVNFAEDYDEVVNTVLHGDLALFVDSIPCAFICDVKKLPARSVGKTENEMTLKGPSEAFIETFRTNTALIRKFVKDENLIFETVEVGKESKTRCAIAYISTITNDSIIKEVKERVESIEIDYLLDSGQLEQLIEDKTFLVDPLILSTERPDKVASHLIEGRVAIIVEGSSQVLIVPAVLSDFTQSSEDSYIRYPYAVLLKLFRFPAIYLAIFLPGIYIAIATFHQEMIPTDLLFAIARYERKSSVLHACRASDYGDIF